MVVHRAHTNGKKLDIDRLLEAINTEGEPAIMTMRRALAGAFPEIVWTIDHAGHLGAAVPYGVSSVTFIWKCGRGMCFDFGNAAFYGWRYILMIGLLTVCLWPEGRPTKVEANDPRLF